MKIKSWKKMMKVILVSLALMGFANGAMAGTWTGWFSIDKLRWSTIADTGTTSGLGGVLVFPIGTLDNPLSCTGTDAYLSASQNATQTLYKELSKMATLAYTAGWQVRVYIDACAGPGSRPHFHTIEIKKP